MGSNSEPVPSFNVLADTRPEDTTLPPFMASTSRGFLPRADPVVDLPEEFAVLSSILDRMPMVTLSGEPGLLAKGALGDTVKAELPDLSAAVEKYSDNLCIQTALYRDYSFIASAYLLEPCHIAYMAKSPYGLGRQTLPRSIALPLSVCARLAGFQPFMEYAGSYALYNYKLENPDVGMKYTNLRLIRAFEKGLDPTSSEAGFVLTHVEMVKNSGPLVEGCVRALDGCGRDDRHEMDDGLDQAFEAIKKVNQVMERKCSTFPSTYRMDNELTRGRYVGKLQARRLHRFPHIHHGYHLPVHVPQRSHLRRRLRDPTLLPRRVRRKRQHDPPPRQPPLHLHALHPPHHDP